MKVIRHKWFRIAFSIFLCELAGIIGSIFTSSSVKEWYPILIKPSFNPPSWVFGPVWTILFALMGIAAYLVYEKGIQKKRVRIALSFFALQLILNVVWSILFFALHNPAVALGEIIILWLSILASLIWFFKVEKTAGYLLIPYMAWVSFASVLNYCIWTLN